MSDLFYGDCPREMPLYQQNEKYEIVVRIEMFSYLQKLSQRWVRNTWVNSSNAERSNCRSCKVLALDFTALVVPGLLNKFL